MRQDSEPSVEDILRSIKRVIARDDAAVEDDAPDTRSERGRPAYLREDPIAMPQVARDEPFPPTEEVLVSDEPDDEILDLAALDAESEELVVAEPEIADDDQPAPAEPLIAGTTAEAMRASLASLRDVAPETTEKRASGSDNALEDMVREMLRPMLRDWLDANLPSLIERMVQREISRITGGR